MLAPSHPHDKKNMHAYAGRVVARMFWVLDARMAYLSRRLAGNNSAPELNSAVCGEAVGLGHALSIWSEGEPPPKIDVFHSPTSTAYALGTPTRCPSPRAAPYGYPDAHRAHDMIMFPFDWPASHRGFLLLPFDQSRLSGGQQNRPNVRTAPKELWLRL